MNLPGPVYENEKITFDFPVALLLYELSKG